YSTYTGTSQVSTNAIALDASSNAYITGEVAQFSAFPVTPGAFQTTLDGSEDAYVQELDATGSNLLDSTYLGGSNVDSGNAIAFGGDPTAFIAQLGADGSSLLYSSFLGGGTGGGIVCDLQNRQFFAGNTTSTSFPTTPGSFQPSSPGGAKGFGGVFVGFPPAP